MATDLPAQIVRIPRRRSLNSHSIPKFLPVYRQRETIASAKVSLPSRERNPMDRPKYPYGVIPPHELRDRFMIHKIHRRSRSSTRKDKIDL